VLVSYTNHIANSPYLGHLFTHFRPSTATITPNIVRETVPLYSDRRETGPARNVIHGDNDDDAGTSSTYRQQPSTSAARSNVGRRLTSRHRGRSIRRRRTDDDRSPSSDEHSFVSAVCHVAVGCTRRSRTTSGRRSERNDNETRRRNDDNHGRRNFVNRRSYAESSSDTDS